MFKKVLLICVAVIVVIAVGLTVYVANMDWNSYKKDIADRFSRTMGKKIEFTGNLSVSLWPKPHLSVQNVNILNPSTSEKIATVKNIEAELSLRALLEGTPEIESLALNGTEIWYIIDENGVSNWRQQQKGSLLDVDVEYNRQTISVQNSWLHYQNRQYEINADFSQLNADIVAESLLGPYRIDGNFVYLENNYGFAVGLGDISQTDDIFLNFAITHPHSNSYILYDGTYNMSSGAFKGNFSGEFQLLATLINSVSGQEMVADMFNVPFVFSVVLDANSNMITLNSLALKYAEVIEGSGNIKIPFTAPEGQKPTIDAQYQFLNLDSRPLMMLFDMWLNALKSGEAGYNPQSQYNVNFDISVQRMAVSDVADGALENMSLKGSWLDDELNIDDFYAGCPGNIVWTMSGTMHSEENLPNLFLKTHFQGKNLAALIRALGYQFTPPSQSAYRNIDIAFNLAANPHYLTFGDIKAMMDKAQLDGNLNVDFSQARSKYELAAQIDNLNLDYYLAAPENTENLTTILKQYLSMLSIMQQADIKADLTLAQIIFRNIPISDLIIAFDTSEDKIEIEEFSLGDVLGAKISLNGSINVLDTKEPTFTDLNYNLSTDNISPLINKLNLILPQWNIFKDKPMQSTGTFSGNLHELQIDTSTTLKNTRFAYSGKIAQNEKFEFDGDAELKSTGFSELVNDLGGHWEKLKNNSAVNCRGHISGQAKDWQFSEAQCVLGTAKYSGGLNLRQEQNLFLINGDIDATEFDLANIFDVQTNKGVADKSILFSDDFLSRPKFNNNTYDFDSYRQIAADIKFSAETLLVGNTALQNVSLKLQNADSILNLDDLQFVYNQAEYAGNLQIDYTKTPKVKGKLKVDNILFNDWGGKTYKISKGTGQTAVDFAAPAISAEEFINNLNGKIDFNITGLGIDGWDINTIEKDLQQRIYSKGVFQMVRDNLQRGHTDFKNCKGQITIKNGVWNFSDTICKNDVANVKMSGEVNTNEWAMNNSFTMQFAELSQLPPIGFSFSGMVNKPALDVNVEEVAKQYDAHWEQVAEQEQAEKAEIQRDLNDKMQQAQKNVTTLAQRINEMSSLLEKYATDTNEEKYIDWYKKKNEYVQYLSGQTDEMTALSRQTDWQAEDVAKINKKCHEYNEDIDAFEKELQGEYFNDLTAQMQTLQEKTHQVKDDNSKIYADYKTKLQEKFSQLIRFDATEDWSNNEKIKNWQDDIEQKRDAFWNMSYQVSDEFMQIYTLKTSEDLRPALDILRPKVEKMSDLTNEISLYSSDVLAFLDEQIERYKDAYNKQQAKLREAEQKEREANKDNLLAKEKSSSLQTNDVAGYKENVIDNEITTKPQAPKINKQHILQEIDENRDIGMASGTILQNYEVKTNETKAQPGGLLRSMEGDDTKINKSGNVSGSISVK